MPDIVADGDNLGDHIATKSFKQIKGSDVASGDAVTLGFGGNTFDITGTTTINHINNTNWVVGSVVILHFDGAVILTHNAGGLSGNEANILLSGDTNFTSSAGDALSFVLHDSTNWVEVSRNVPSSSYTAPTLGSTALTSGATISTVAGLTLTSPTLTTPALGTPASGVATNLTGTASGLTSGNVTTNANLTGGVTSSGNATTVVTNANLTGDVTSSGNATTIAVDAVDIAMLSAGGTASSSTYLRGDNQWGALSSYSAPTLGTTSIGSGATVGTIDGLTLTGVTRLQNTSSNLGTTGTINLDFAGNEIQLMPALTGNITFTGSNYAVGRTKTIRILGHASTDYTLAFPSGWTFIGSTAPTKLSASKTAILTLTSMSTDEANIVASYAYSTTTSPVNSVVESIIVAASDETTALTTGTAKSTFRMPYAFTLTAVKVSLTTTSSSGNPTIDVNESGTSILSSPVAITAGQKTATASVSDTSLANLAEITIDIDVAGTGATGAKVYLIGYQS